MPNITEFDAFLSKLVKRFQNISYIDPAITLDDLWGEAYEIYAKLSKDTTLSCSLITALGRQVEQRFLDIYKMAKRLNSHLDRNHFVEDFAARKVRLSRIQFSELPEHLKRLVRKIYENPEEIGKYFPNPSHIDKRRLVKYLTKELKWQRQVAVDFSKQVNQTRRKPTHLSSQPAHY